MTISITGSQARPVASADIPMAVRVAKSGGFTYIGEAAPGAADADAVWRIQRVDADGNTVWADGDAAFDNIWANYLSLTYV